MLSPNDITQTFKRVTLEHMKVALPELRFLKDLLNRSDIDFFTLHLADEIIMRLHTFVTADTKTETREYVDSKLQVPTSAWEHLKQDYAPKWFKARWPAKTYTYEIHRTVVTTSTHICPHHNLPTDNRKHVEFVLYGQ